MESNLPTVDSSRASGLEDLAGASPAAPDLEPGTVLNDRYSILGLLGRGGMGVVYRADDLLHPGRPVALKTIHGRFLGAERLSLFRSEFRTMADLRHPNIAAVYDFEPARGRGESFFTMEYVDGRDLKRATEGASFARIVELVPQICRALSFLHSRGIIHCDIKPGNILVDGEGRARLLDFGVATAGKVSSVRGTPAYMAPELFASDVPIDHRVDLYSLGIVIHEIVLRRLPFAARSQAEMRRLHASAAIEWPADAPVALRHVVGRLTAKDPAERYSSANAVIEDLNHHLGTQHQLETAATRESYILSSRLVGRDAERERVLAHVWRTTGEPLAPGPVALLVAGPSGMGKSRLLREARLLAQLAGLPVVESSCYEAGLGELAPAADALAQVIRVAGAAGIGALVDDYAGELARVDRALVPDRPADADAGGDGKPEDRRLALLDRLSELIIRVAERTPYVLHVNDLQWARPALIDLLRNLVLRVALRVRAGQVTRLAILGSYRSDEVDGRPLEKLLALGAEVETVALAPLPPEAVERLVGSMLGIATLPRAFVDRVARETEGNPFFVEEVMRSLVDRGAVFLSGGAWAAKSDVGDLEIPASIARVFRRRVALLDLDARRMLELMAVFGRPAPAGLLARLGGRTDVETHAALGALLERQMVVRMAGSQLTYGIGHDRMRETVYDELAAPERQAVHHAIATALEEAPGGLDANLYEIAHHAWLAGDDARALRTSLLAGDRAKASYANELALEHFGHALELLGDDRARRQEVEEKLADVESLTGRYAEAAARYQRLFGGIEAPIERARLLRKQGELDFLRGDFERAVEPLWSAVELLGDPRPRSSPGWVTSTGASFAVHLERRLLGQPRPATGSDERAGLRERCAAYTVLGQIYYFTDPRRMLLPLFRAGNLGERLGDSAELCRNYGQVCYFYSYMGMPGSSRTYGREALAMAERTGSSLDTGIAATYFGVSLNNLGACEAAREQLERGKALLARHGDLFTFTIAEMNLDDLLVWQGLIRRAAESAEEVMQLVERTGSAYGKSILAALGWFRGLLGDQARSAACLGEALGLAVASKDQVAEITVLTFRGDLEHARGEHAAAVETLSRARAILEQTGSKLWVVGRILPLLALSQLELAPPGPLAGPARRAIGRAVEEALAYTRRRLQRRSCALLADAAFLWRSGRRERARRRFDEAIAVATAQGQGLHAAEARLELGRTLARDGQRDEARAVLAQAAADLEAFEAAPLLARARAALAGLT